MLGRLTSWEQARARRLGDSLYAGWLRGAQAVVDYDGPAGESPPDDLLGNWRAPDGSYMVPARRELLELFRHSWIQGAGRYFLFFSQPFVAGERCARRATRLQLALTLFAARELRPPDALSELVPRYLPQLPNDPYSGRPFGYRLSTGETIAWDRSGDQEESRAVPPGMGVLWSVDRDGADDGGHRNAPAGARTNPDWTSQGADLIFLVPYHFPKR
jgi:hypothetical protein